MARVGAPAISSFSLIWPRELIERTDHHNKIFTDLKVRKIAPKSAAQAETKAAIDFWQKLTFPLGLLSFHDLFIMLDQPQVISNSVSHVFDLFYL